MIRSWPSSSWIEYAVFSPYEVEDKDLTQDDLGEMMLSLEGYEYSYYDVPYYEYVGLVNSSSPGMYFNHIKDSYRYH